jgi:hypothetical protein
VHLEQMHARVRCAIERRAWYLFACPTRWSSRASSMPSLSDVARDFRTVRLAQAQLGHGSVAGPRRIIREILILRPPATTPMLKVRTSPSRIALTDMIPIAET